MADKPILAHGMAGFMNPFAKFDSSQPEVLSFSALQSILGKRSRQSIYDLLRRDPSFPRPRQIGSEFSVGWLRGEIIEWISSLPLAELNGLDAVERRRRASGREHQMHDESH